MQNIKEKIQDFEDYKKERFTEKGYNILQTFLKELLNCYINKKEEEYPFELGRVLGVPYFKWAHEIKDKEELMGRIKLLAQLVGVDKIEIKVGDSIITHEFKLEIE